MHVLIVSAVFPPEPVTSSITSEHLAVGLVHAGHQVTVITGFPTRPSPGMFSGYRPVFRLVEQAPAGYTIIRTKSYSSLQSTARTRFVENLTFGFNSLLNALPTKPDVVYSNSWPIFATGMIAGWCAVRHIPMVVSVQDIHPESAIQLGKLPANGPIPGLMRAIDRHISRRAAALVTISENFVDFYKSKRGVAAAKVHLVPNWLDAQEITPGPRDNDFRARHQLASDDFVVMYAGNIGAVAGVDTIVEAALLIQDHRRVKFVIIGNGSGREACLALAQQHALHNILFVDSIPREELALAQAAADVLVLPTRKGGALTSVPSKLIAYMLSQRPVLAAVDRQSDSAQIINRVVCGACVPPEDAQALANQICSWQDNPEELLALGMAGRRYAEAHFSRQQSVPKLVSILETTVTGKT